MFDSLERYFKVDDVSVLVELSLGPHFELCGNPQEQAAAFALLTKCRREGISWETIRSLLVESLSEAAPEQLHMQLAHAQGLFRPWLS